MFFDFFLSCRMAEELCKEHNTARPTGQQKAELLDLLVELYRYVMTRLTFDWLGAFQTKTRSAGFYYYHFCVSDPIIHLTVDVLILQLLGFFFF